MVCYDPSRVYKQVLTGERELCCHVELRVRCIEISILYEVENLDIEILKNEIGNTIGPSNILNAYELT